MYREVEDPALAGLGWVSLRRGNHGRRSVVWAAIAILTAGCASSSASPGASTSAATTGQPSAGAGSAVASVSLAPASVAPSPSASISTVARLPVGRVVYDRLAGNAEGNYLGTNILDTNGNVTDVTLPVDNATAIWSPSGRRLLVDSYSDATGGAVGIYDLTTSAYTELHPQGMTGQLDCTDWTPDEASVICGRGGPDPSTDGIYLVNVGTGATKRLTHSRYHHATGSAGECGGGEDRAVFSGDGKRFAYEQQKCGTGADPGADEEGDVVVVNADGSGAKVVAPFGDVRTHAGGELSWSPTSDEIVFGTQDGKLSLVHADGSGLRAVGQPDDTFAFGPAWSPDGKWILVTVISNVTGHQDLYAISPDGTSQMQLTDSELVEAYTDWGPAAA